MPSLCFSLAAGFLALVIIHFPEVHLFPEPIKVDMDWITAYVKQVQPISLELPSVLINSTDDMSVSTISSPLVAHGRAKGSLTKRGIYVFYTASVRLDGMLNVSKQRPTSRQCPDPALQITDCNVALHLSAKQDMTGLPILSTTTDLCPIIVGALTDASSSANSLEEHPPLQPGATPCQDSLFFQALRNIAAEVPSEVGFSPAVEFISDTGVRLTLALQKPIQASLSSSYTPSESIGGTGAISSLKRMMGRLILQIVTLQRWGHVIADTAANLLGVRIEDYLELEWAKDVKTDLLHNTSYFLNSRIPEGALISFDLILQDLRCTYDGYYCSVPSTNGLLVRNLRIMGCDEMSLLFTAFFSKPLEHVINEVLNSVTSSSPWTTGTRFNIPMQKADVITVPHVAIITVFPVTFFLVSTAIIARNVRAQRKRPTLLKNGTPMSLIRLVVEDTVICGVTFGTFMCFLLSDTTTVASVTVGKVIQAYSFSLMATVTDLYNSGLQPLAVFVFIFSGVYPYIKLLCILLFSVVLYKPNSRILKVIDYVGKASFLDTFVMVVMSAGLQIPGVADVELLPPYYIFLAATASSIAIGNYACHYWRHGTDLRGEMVSPHNDYLVGTFGKTWRAVQRGVPIITGLVLLSLTLPSWVCNILRYDAGGLGSITLPKHRYFTLYSLSKNAGSICLVVTLATIAVAPILYAIAFPKFPILASWTTADVLLLAIVCGLLQLNQFLQFVLGGDYDTLYNVHAKMLWPLAPLLVSSILTWILVVCDIALFHRAHPPALSWKPTGPSEVSHEPHANDYGLPSEDIEMREKEQCSSGLIVLE